MTRLGLPFWAGFLSALVLLQCESDPSKDSENPGLFVPIRPLPSEASRLNLEAKLNGRYVQGISIDKGNWRATGPGQDLALTFRATGMRNVRQFRLKVQADPADAFDLTASRFTSVEPFFAPGIDLPAPGQVETGAAIFGNQQVEGDGALGTLTLRTSPAFTAATRVRLQVILFSIGPNSTSRDEYSAEEMNLGVVINDS